jgi:ribosomal protein S18 acetylase RimI-like enzyme|tara:strand:- start:643 stop:1083 length:441 start_codon:yes stop_codon:yes gene_type:complete
VSEYKIAYPSSIIEFKSYYYFRWLYLRKPLNKKLGSEKDSLESKSIHRMITYQNKIIAVGRFHEILKLKYQIRYFAVDEKFRRKNIGSLLMKTLEADIRNKGGRFIILNARENAIDFYKSLNYSIIKKTNLLFGKIQHYEMMKIII